MESAYVFFRIFQFQNFRRTRKRVLEDDEEEEVEGALVRL